MDRIGEDFNSFEAIDAAEKAVIPPSFEVHKAGTSSTATANTTDGTAPRALPQKSASQVLREATRVKEERKKTKKKDKGNLSLFHFLSATVFRTAGEEIKLKMMHENSFDVVGGVSDAELELLRCLPPGNRFFRVQTWMVRMMTNRLANGGLAIAPPLLSRTYQVLSDGTAAALQGRKVAHVEFPFALRQLLAVLIAVFLALAPICIAAFVDSVPLVAVLSFFTCVGYTALNETARELEMPFGLDANDLNLVEYQRDFNQKLAQLLDQTVPELGYQETASPMLSSGADDDESAVSV